MGNNTGNILGKLPSCWQKGMPVVSLDPHGSSTSQPLETHHLTVRDNLNIKVQAGELFLQMEK